MTDILIIGAGPAALSLAAAVGRQGMSVCCVAPVPSQPWHQNYGAWGDDLGGLGMDTVISRTWPRAMAHLQSSGAPVFLERDYVQLSAVALQTWLQTRCMDGAVRLVSGQVVDVAHGAVGSQVTLSDGQILSGRVVVDASGHGSGFLQHVGSHADAWQVAYGQLLHLPGGHPWPVGVMGFMDFRSPDTSGLWTSGPPTFLYVMPLDAERVFVEETTLIARPAPDMGWLAARLAARLAAAGLSPGAAAVQGEERCVIRMLGAEPVLGQRTVGFGAAAGMVHPATGYLLPRVLHTAAPLAAALAATLGREGASPAAAAQAGWAALWPPARRRQWSLYRFGAEILCALDGPQIRDFFGAYFSLPPAMWRGFLSATLSPLEMAHTMATMFSLSTPTIRRRLVQAGLSRQGASLLREMVLA